MKYKVYRTVEEVGHAAKLALKARLHLPASSGILRDILIEVSHYGTAYCKTIVLAFDGENPIGIVAHVNRNALFYVRKPYRRKGIGTKLYRKLVKVNDKRYGFYTDCCPNFFKSIKSLGLQKL